jgi:hypothetical protein
VDLKTEKVLKSKVLEKWTLEGVAPEAKNVLPGFFVNQRTPGEKPNDHHVWDTPGRSSYVAVKNDNVAFDGKTLTATLDETRAQTLDRYKGKVQEDRAEQLLVELRLYLVKRTADKLEPRGFVSWGTTVSTSRKDIQSKAAPLKWTDGPGVGVWNLKLPD